MRSSWPEEPRVFVVKGGELSLSGQALLELMQAVLARGVPFRFCARGWSMAPFIHDGDVITVDPIREAPPGVGEVIAFTRPQDGRLVVHRVIARNTISVVVKGDSIGDQADGMIPPQSILGRVRRIEHGSRTVWLGLGPEKYLIAWLSRLNVLIPLRMWLASRFTRS